MPARIARTASSMGQERRRRRHSQGALIPVNDLARIMLSLAKKPQVRKGVFVPLEIWHISELNPNERVLLAEVASFNEQKKKCYATNKHFADLLQVSEQTARKYIYHLIELGYSKEGGGTKRTGWYK